TYQQLMRKTYHLFPLSVQRSNQRRTLPQGAQDSSLGALQRLSANIYSRPIEYSAILFRRERKDLHLRIPPKQKAALGDAFVGVVQRENQDVGLGFLDRFCELGLMLYFTNHLDIRLVSDDGEDKLPHQSWPVCNQNSYSLHEHTPKNPFYLVARGRTRFNYVLEQHREGKAYGYPMYRNVGTY